jgi:phosphosulfolactate phosphohydrolase-like enzyme
LAAAALHSEEARGVVTAARTAAEAVEQLVSERETASRVEAAKREQHALDDMARARYVVGQRGQTH